MYTYKLFHVAVGVLLMEIYHVTLNRAIMLLVLSEEHKQHLGFLTRVDVEGRSLRIAA